MAIAANNIRSYRVESIDGDTLTLTDSNQMYCSIRWKAVYGETPSIGDEILVDGVFGSPIRGFYFPDGAVIKSAKTMELENKVWLSEYDDEKERNWTRNQRKWLEQVDELDKPFRNRMKRFFDKYGSAHAFFIEDGGYELFCVSQANSLYRHWQKQYNIPAAVWFDWFYGLSYDEQKREWDEMEDGHSGNTFGATVALAKRVAMGLDI